MYGSSPKHSQRKMGEFFHSDLGILICEINDHSICIKKRRDLREKVIQGKRALPRCKLVQDPSFPPSTQHILKIVQSR